MPQPELVLALQRSAGNHAVARMLREEPEFKAGFWEQVGDGHVWHDERPGGEFEPVRDETGGHRKYGRWHDLRSYPVFRRREAAPASEPEKQAVAPPAQQRARAKRTKPRPPAPQPVVAPEEEPGRLLEQVGPSCWLFVIEAMANFRGLDTSLLSSVLYLYPASPLAETLDRTQRLHEVVSRLTAISGSIPAAAGHCLYWQRFQRDAQETCPLVHRDAMRTFAVRLLAPLEHTARGYRASDIRARVLEAVALAQHLRDEVAKEGAPGQDEEAKLLGGSLTIVDKEIKDEHLGPMILDLLEASGGVLLMGISQRFDPDDYKRDPAVRVQRDVYDFTNVPPAKIEEGGPHAVLLIDCIPSQRIIRYRDPNFGNAVIVITFDHIRRMAELWGKVEFYAMPSASKSAGIKNVLKPRK